MDDDRSGSLRAATVDPLARRRQGRKSRSRSTTGTRPPNDLFGPCPGGRLEGDESDRFVQHFMALPRAAHRASGSGTFDTSDRGLGLLPSGPPAQQATDMRGSRNDGRRGGELRNTAREATANGTTALATRPRRTDRTDRLVVVSDTLEVPTWIRDWCRAAGWALHVHRVPAVVPGHLGLPGRVVPEIGALLADPVLVLQGGSTGAGLREVTAPIHALPDDVPVLVAAADTARHLDGRVVLVHGLPVSFAERSVGLTSALLHGRRVLDAAARWIAAQAPDLRVVTRLVRAHPYELVGEDLDTGLLVVGGPRRDVSDDLGLVARSALHHATCPVLIVPR